jgi:hypothetical protein
MYSRKQKDTTLTNKCVEGGEGGFAICKTELQDK